MRSVLLRHAAAGAALGVLTLHPVAEAIHWFETRASSGPSLGQDAMWPAIGRRLLLVFSPGMLLMTGAYAVVGAGFGLVLGWSYRKLQRQPGPSAWLEREFGRDPASLISGGEDEHVEFKASARWDYTLGRTNKALETAVVRAIAGLLNDGGGNLLIGVADDGTVIGLEHDYRTLKRPNRDGFEQLLMGLVRAALGGDLCPRVHARFFTVGAMDLCRIIVEPSDRPVYFQDGPVARYLVRTGNGTRELDVREALEHVPERWPGWNARRSGRAAPRT